MNLRAAARVVITGLGTINPLGHTVPEYWDNLIQGRSGLRRVRNTDLSSYPVKIGGEIDLPDCGEYFPRKGMLRRMDRFVIFAHIAATQALKDSGLDVNQAPERCGVVIGNGGSGIGVHFKNIQTTLAKGMDFISPFYVVGSISGTGAGYFAKASNLQGPNFSVSTACASSNHAIGLAALLIKMGMADAVLAGGSEAVAQTMGYGGFGAIQVLSTRNDSPETASRPFDRGRDGFVISEGAGVICLEEMEHARKRGAHIYGELTGVGFTCDAFDFVAPHPEGLGACRAMELALESASLNTGDIDLINAHGTSTHLGDLSESRAIVRTFKQHGKTVRVHSTKSMVGHLLGAAGGVEAVAAIMALERGVIHATANQFEPDPEIEINVVRNTPVEARVEHILCNSFGFSGQNAAIVISRFRP